jgi:hypothetical protein
MSIREMSKGILMLGVAAFFTWALASVLEQLAVERAIASHAGPAPDVAAYKLPDRR